MESQLKLNTLLTNNVKPNLLYSLLCVHLAVKLINISRDRIKCFLQNLPLKLYERVPNLGDRIYLRFKDIKFFRQYFIVFENPIRIANKVKYLELKPLALCLCQGSHLRLYLWK